MSNKPPRRGSIFGGLLLILIGTIFLLYYWAPGTVHLEVLARYWPVLLILWGLARVFDHFAAQRESARPPRWISGGEFFLLLILLVGAGLLMAFPGELGHIRMDGPDSIFGQQYTFSSELPPAAVKPDDTIAIVTPHGDLAVRPEDSSTLRVIVTKTVTAESESAAQTRAQHLQASIRQVPGGYQVEALTTGERRDAEISLEVHVPRKAKVSAKTDHGDIQVADLEGPLTVSTRKGNIEIHNAGGDVTAELSSGDARISDARGNLTLSGAGGELELDNVAGSALVRGEFYGPIRARNVAQGVHFLSSRTDLTIASLPGRMEMDSGKLGVFEASGSVLLTTRNKDIEMENIGGRLQIADRHGDIEVRFRQPPRDEITINNDSGSVDLALPPKSSCEISAVSRSGDVDSEFSDPGLKLTQQGDTSQLAGKLGPHGPVINITTSYGTIHLRKSA